MKKGDTIMEIWRFVFHNFMPKVAYWFGIASLNPESAE